MSVQKKPATANKSANAGKAPKKLTPRTAPPLEKAAASPTPAAAPAPSAAPATAAATARARKPAAVEPAIAQGQKVLAEALSKAQAAKTTQPAAPAEVALSAAKATPPAKVAAPVKAAKPLTKPAAKAAAKPLPPAKDKKPVKAEKPAKVKKLKLVRDSYAMPEAEYARIGELKKRLAGLGSDVKKSELLRAGVAALVALNDADLKTLLGKIERIKTGRPAK